MIKRRPFFLVCLCFLLISGRADAQPAEALPRSSPEKEGVSSGGLLNFVKAAGKSKNEFHSFMLLRHGKVIAEGWWDPYRPGLKHTLYSVSKSFTSTAVGFAVTEGLLNVNDKIVSFFPDDLPDTVSPYLAALTIKDLLCMLEGQDPDPTTAVANGDPNWAKGFLKTPIINKPGAHFLYNTMGVYMLAAIVEKRTGQHLVDYLKPRLFDPLGITGADWESSPTGVNNGGWGLRLRTEDMAKMGELYLQKGKWKGKQLLPESWVEAATASYNDEGPRWAVGVQKDSSDWRQGYGYLFWRCRHDAFRADGAYGQLIVVMPKEDAVLAVTGETSNMQDEVNLIWNYLLPAMHKAPLSADPAAETALRQTLSSLALPVAAKTLDPQLEKAISGKTFFIKSNDPDIETIRIGFDGIDCHVDVKIDSVDYPLQFGAGKWEKGETAMEAPVLAAMRISKLAPFPVAGSYRWKDGDTLELKLRYIETPHTQTILCHFDQDRISMRLESSFDFGKKKLVLEGVAKE